VGGHPHYFSMLFNLVCAVCSVFMCFSGQVSAVQVWGSVSYVVPDLRLPSGIVFFCHIGDNVTF
jgi:hypothetical protein